MLIIGAWRPAAASSAGPQEQGWWWSANPGIAGLAAPNPPDVPQGGLLVEGGVGSTAGSTDSQPTAFAALVYQIPSGSTAEHLDLVVAAGSTSTSSSSLELCPLQQDSMRPESGGPMSDAPAYDCAHSTSAKVGPDGKTYQFAVQGLSSASALAIAILPTAATDRVVLDPPTASSLSLSATSTVEPVTGSVPPVQASPSATIPTTIPPVADGVPAGAAGSTQPAVVPSATTGVTSNASPNFAPAPVRPSTAAALPLSGPTLPAAARSASFPYWAAFVLPLVLAVGAWYFGRIFTAPLLHPESGRRRGGRQ